VAGKVPPAWYRDEMMKKTHKLQTYLPSKIKSNEGALPTITTAILDKFFQVVVKETQQIPAAFHGFLSLVPLT